MVSHSTPARPSYTNVISLPEGQEWGGVLGLMGGGVGIKLGIKLAVAVGLHVGLGVELGSHKSGPVQP